MLTNGNAVEKGKYMEALHRKWTTYGDMLEVLADPVDELTLYQPESLHGLGCLHDSILGIAANLCVSIAALALAGKNYVDSRFDLSDPNILEYTKSDYSRAYQHTQNGLRLKNRSSIEMLRFTNIQDAKDEYIVCIFQGWPEWRIDNSEFPYISEHLIKNLKEKINEIDGKLETTTKRIIIVDGFLMHLFRPLINTIKSELNRSFPTWQLLSIEEFLRNIFSDDWQEYVDEFAQIREEARKVLEHEYPFLIPHREAELTFRSRNQIQSSMRKLLNGEIEKANEIETSVQQAMKGIEGLLQVLYRRNFRKQPESSLTFGDLLSALRETVTDEFGDDTLDDLDYLNGIRNAVSHPRAQNLSKRDLIKSIWKAVIFMQLFDDYVGLERRRD